ncbi:MAG: Aldehyde Dehydrogenase, partial [Gemmatimonadetes bacterium]|nr:Aldehyde Dehydrogenase [Gemmatimonadota bacterium]
MTTVRDVFETMEYGPAPEGDKPARDWLAKFDGRFGHYINGGWTKPAGLFDVSNPATGKPL